MSQPLWLPSEERIARANMTAFARQVADAHGKELWHYAQLRQWSVDHPEPFWQALWRFADVRAGRGWDRVLDCDR
ncbi:MAG: acetoacetate--CoA ligase, partial [Geminicoccales bacterium]